MNINLHDALQIFTGYSLHSSRFTPPEIYNEGDQNTNTLSAIVHLHQI